MTKERQINNNQKLFHKILKQITNPKLPLAVAPMAVLSKGPFLILASGNSGEGNIPIPNTCQVSHPNYKTTPPAICQELHKLSTCNLEDM